MSSSISRRVAKTCVGPGWSKLIDKLYDKISLDVKVVQVKEKFGGLRFYVYNATEDEVDFISFVEEESYTVCERCGQPGKLRTDRNWVLTLCDECDKIE